jgi:hypothetical protein
MYFPYRTESPRLAIVMAAFCIVGAVLVQLLLFKVILLACGSGPAAWALIQWRRRGRGVTLADDHIMVQRALARTPWRVPYSCVRGFAATRRDALALVHEEQHKAPVQPTLRPDSFKAMSSRRLIDSAPLEDPDALIAALATRLQSVSDAALPFEEEFVLSWLRRRRIRNIVFLVTAILATPIYVTIVGRIISSFLYEVYANGR